MSKYILFLFLFLIPGIGNAQQPITVARLNIDGPAPPQAPDTVARGEDGKITLRAVRLEEPIDLDGALNDEIYQRVPPVRNFVQQYPSGGVPATEDTEVWILFDDRNIYVSMRCWDSHPELMVANEMRRDNLNIWMNDNVSVAIDTFYDRRSAYFFQTNPVAGVRDALVLDETITNYNWNTVWTVRTHRFDRGWTVEMAIPFKSLRYEPGSDQIWGFNVMRVVRSKNEQSLLSPVPRTYGNSGLMRLSSAATLVGVVAPKASANVELKPYAISNLTTNRPAHISNSIDAAFGADVKYGITSSLTADLTYNTDFAQVEIDEQQVNLTRFSLFFPEKRDFFLEGQGIFDFAGSSGRGGNDDTPILFYTRRIGLNAGQPVPIDVGGRLMGRVGRTSLGILNIQTSDTPKANAAATNFSVVRLRRDVLRKSTVGLIATNRTATAPGVPSNQALGADANFSLYDNVRISSYYARTSAAGPNGDAASYRHEFQYDADRYGFDIQESKVGDAFNPEIGFVRRKDFRKTFAQARFSPRVTSIPGVRQLTWEMAGNQYVSGRGGVESSRRRGTFSSDFENGDAFKFDFYRVYERVPAPFVVDGGLTVPAGPHWFHEINATYTLGSQRRISGTVSLERNGFYSDGRQTQASYTGRVIFNPRLAVEPRVTLNWIEMPQGNARISLLSARPIVTIGPQMYVSALVQYNSSTHSLESNARWRWEYQPGSDLFVVYTDGRETAGTGFPSLLNRAIAVKLTRFLRF